MKRLIEMTLYDAMEQQLALPPERELVHWERFHSATLLYYLVDTSMTQLFTVNFKRLNLGDDFDPAKWRLLCVVRDTAYGAHGVLESL